MNAALEARDLITRIAGPQPLGHSVKAALRAVARKTGIGDRRIRALWNQEARAILSAEMDRLRQISALEEARAELHQVDAFIVRATDTLAVRETDIVRPVAAHEGPWRRASDRPLASRE